MENVKLTEKSLEVFNFVKEKGGRVLVTDVAEALGRAPRSINATVNDLVKKELAVREKQSVEDKTITYVCITDAGQEAVIEVKDAK